MLLKRNYAKNKHPARSIEWNSSHLLFPARESDVRCSFSGPVTMTPKARIWLASCRCCSKGSLKTWQPLGKKVNQPLFPYFIYIFFTFFGEGWRGRRWVDSFFLYFTVNTYLKASLEYLTLDSGWQGALPSMKTMQEPDSGWGRRGNFQKEEEVEGKEKRS